LDSTSPDYLQEECLVYFIRDYFRKGQKDIVNNLSKILLHRSAKNINGQLQPLEPDTNRDAYNDVINELFVRIFDLQNDRADFLQVRYWHALKMLTISVFRNYCKFSKRAQRTVSLSTLEDLDFHATDHEVTSVSWDDVLNPPPSVEQLALKGDALSILDERHRTAFILYHEGWQVESQDPAEPTISSLFQVTGRTIRNWLKEAQQQLERWRGENDKA
jgi:DNA-directed RNA polymerase specialized sigma24 family protein